MVNPLVKQLIKIAWPLARTMVGKLLQDSVSEKAIKATTEQFQEIEGVSQHLQQWCSSDSFATILERLTKGERDLADSALIDSFVETTKFFCGDDTVARATELLEAFLANLTRLIYSEPESGLSALANRQEVLNAEVLAKVLAKLDNLEGYQSNRATDSKEKDAAFVARIDVAKGLIDKGHPTAARELLETLESEIRGGSIQGALTYRVFMNLGVVAMLLDDLMKAHSYFTAALLYKEEDSNALANLAQVFLQQKKLTEALDFATRAWSQSPRDSYAMAIYIRSLHASGRNTELNVLLAANSWILQDRRCALMLGEISYAEANLLGSSPTCRGVSGIRPADGTCSRSARPCHFRNDKRETPC